MAAKNQGDSTCANQRSEDLKLPSVAALRAKHPELFEKSDLMGLWFVLEDWLHILLAAGLSIWADHWLATTAAVLFIGFKQLVMTDVGVHLVSHNTLFKTSTYNKYIEFFIAAPFLRTVAHYRSQHYAHHRDLATESDQVYLLYNIMGLGNERVNLYWQALVEPFLGRIAMIFLTRWRWGHLRTNSLKNNGMTVLFYALFTSPFIWFGHLDWFLIYWAVPFFFMLPAFTCLNEVAEHYKCRSPSRTRLGIVNYFMHNEGYHHVHHIYPNVVWFKMKEAHEILKPYFGEIETCHGFILGPLLNIRRQMNIPYVTKYKTGIQQIY